MGFEFLKLLKIIEESRLDVFTTTSLANRMGVPSSSIQNYLETLANNELIKRIEKGRYCRTYIDDKYVIGSHLVEGGVVSYQSALAFHGLDKDIPGEVYISSPLQKNSKTVFGNKISFVRIRPHKEFGVLNIQGPEGSFRVTDTEKTLLDCLDLPKHVRSYAKLLQKIGEVPFDQEKMIEYGKRMRNLSILKRMAFMFDKALPDKHKEFQQEVAKMLNLKYTLLDPGGPDTGPFSTKWRIRNNLQFEL